MPKANQAAKKTTLKNLVGSLDKVIDTTEQQAKAYEKIFPLVAESMRHTANLLRMYKSTISDYDAVLKRAK